MNDSVMWQQLEEYTMNVPGVSYIQYVLRVFHPTISDSTWVWEIQCHEHGIMCNIDLGHSRSRNEARRECLDKARSLRLATQMGLAPHTEGIPSV